MKKLGTIAAALAALASGAESGPAQVGGSGVPALVFRFNPEYQSAVAAVDRDRADPEDDARWAERRAKDLTEFYGENGARLLRLLSEYAGVRWPYEDIQVYGLRYFPTLSIEYPLTIAVGEIRDGGARQEVPGGDFLILTLAHQITHYLLDPPPGTSAAGRPRVLDHPLMEEGSYRREALVNLVAYRALEDLWRRERLGRARREPLWASYNPESAFVDSLAARWTLSPSRPLVSWLQQEDEDGPLVRLAERLEASRGPASETDVSGGGQGTRSMAGNEVGLDLGQSAEGRLFIAFIDPRSPADAAGLRSGDVVLTIEGRRFTSAAEAMRVLRDAWETNREVNLSVERQGKEVFFQIH